MKRRSFVQNVSAGFMGTFLVPGWYSQNFFPSQPESFKIAVEAGQNQIRHGALSLPQVGKSSFTTPFKWLGEIKRNLFFGKGFQRDSSDSDIEIISVLFKNPITDIEEPIQIQLDKEGITVLFEEDHFYEKKADGIVAIAHKEEANVKMYYGQFRASESFGLDCNNNAEYFIYNLGGELLLNDSEQLAFNEGFGFSKIDKINFTILVPTQVLIIETF